MLLNSFPSGQNQPQTLAIHCIDDHHGPRTFHAITSDLFLLLALYIVVRFLDREGKPQELAADELLATCIQHEMDHLDGKLFIDYLSPLKREMVRKKLAKQRKLAGDAA